MPGCDACQAGDGGGARRDVPTGLNRLFADTLPQELVGVVEILEEAAEECIAVCGHRFFDPGKYATIHALGIVGRLEQVWWHPGDDHGCAHTFGTVPPQVSGDLASSHGEAGQDEIVQL